MVGSIERRRKSDKKWKKIKIRLDGRAQDTLPRETDEDEKELAISYEKN